MIKVNDIHFDSLLPSDLLILKEAYLHNVKVGVNQDKIHCLLQIRCYLHQNSLKWLTLCYFETFEFEL